MRLWRIFLSVVVAHLSMPDAVNSTTPAIRNERRLDMSGFTEFTLDHGGYTRQFWVYVPSNFLQPIGLVLFFHGLSQSVSGACGGDIKASFTTKPEADTYGFIVVCPRGTGSDDNSASERGWNNEACCGHASVYGVDDVGFTQSMLNYLRDDILPNSYNVAYPTKNIFAFGFSTGGLFSYRLACELKDHIHGIAPTGAVFDHAFTPFQRTMAWATNCVTSVPVWNSIGTADIFTTEARALQKWRYYSQQILSCNSAEETTSSPQNDVTCYGYDACGAAKSQSEMCVYEGAKHQVKPLGETYNYWHTKNAWIFLTSSLAQGSSITSTVAASASSFTTITGPSTTTQDFTTQTLSIATSGSSITRALAMSTSTTIPTEASTSTQDLTTQTLSMATWDSTTSKLSATSDSVGFGRRQACWSMLSFIMICMSIA